MTPLGSKTRGKSRTVSGGGTSSLEATTATTGLGLSVNVVSNSAWPSEIYSNYKAIVLGDRNCQQNTTADITAAETNATVWAAVRGKVD